MQTVEDLFGQLAPALGAVLDWPQVSAVSALKAEGTRVVVQQEYSGGYSAALSVTLPAVTLLASPLIVTWRMFSPFIVARADRKRLQGRQTWR